MIHRIVYYLLPGIWMIAAAVSATTLSGTVTNPDQEPLINVHIAVPELQTGTISDATGTYEIHGLPTRPVTVQFSFIGYKTLEKTVDLSAGPASLDVSLTPTTIEMRPLIVRDQTLRADDPRAPLREMAGQNMRQNLSMTIAETMDNEPGLAKRSMGPAPARPVIRGLSGDRLLILEDGERTGDLSATSSDHAVVIEPITAERIELIRGPGALLYGSNTLGGVINVKRGYIPTQQPEHLRGISSVQGESVNTGYAGSLSLVAPVGPLTARMDGSWRDTRDIATPVGDLQNTDLNTANGSLGLSLIREWGLVGAAASLYDSAYGIPGGFAGAHPNGVTVNVERQHLESRAIYTPTRVKSWLQRLEFHQNYAHYYHEELESNGVLGISFRVHTHKFQALAHLKPGGVFNHAAVGIWSEFRDYGLGGLSFAPDTRERSLAGFGYADMVLGKINVAGGLRFDTRTIDPDDDEEGIYDAEVGLIRKRTFDGLSGSLKASYRPHPHWEISAILTRSFRSPLSEELYSQGPHLAAYSYEVGNADLEAEYGLGKEISLRYETARGQIDISFFRNDIADYIFVKETGDTVWNLILPKYKHSGLDAVLQGLEGALDWRLIGQLSGRTTISYVHAQLTENDEPIPRIPPLSGRFELRYKHGNMTVGSILRAAAEQDRVGEFEQPTDGYTVVDVFAQYIFTMGGVMHSLDVGLENIADTEYRQHLSRTKSVMPEAGRNLKLLYKVYF